MGKHYQIVWVNTIEFPGREVPLVLLDNGKPGYLINQWIFYLHEEEITQATLDLYLRALCHLYDFVLSRYSEPLNQSQLKGLLADFIDAKKLGTDTHCLTSDPRYSWLHSLGLYWKPLFKQTNTIALYLNAINKFDEWQISFHASQPLNPYEKRLMSSWEIYQDFQQRTNWDPFLHLYSAKQHVKKEYQNSVYGKYLHKRHLQESTRKKAPKSFPLDRYIELIECTKNPRDKLLWLLMGGGALRRSETLHLFLSDVQGVDPHYGDMRVALEDPETGFMEWHSEDQIPMSGSRIEYFKSNFRNYHFSPGHPLRNLQPRSRYGKRNTGLHAGFKGMTFGDTDSIAKLLSSDNLQKNPNPHYIWWLDVKIGQYFSRVFEEYIQHFFWRNNHTGIPNPSNWPWHPWLLICTSTKNYGMPLTIPSLKGAWKRALKRIGMEGSGLGPHSLRHMYGYYCANVLKLPLEVVQVLMHHANPSSTQCYYSLEKSVIREMIQNAALLDKRISIEWAFNKEEVTY